MHRPHPHLLLLALPAIAVSFGVLAFGGVAKGIWLIHLLAIFLSSALALAGGRLIRLVTVPFPAVTVIVLALAAIAMPLLYDSPGPNRWAQLGPLSLYMAPVVIPSLLVACSLCFRAGGSKEAIALAATLGASVILALQPDACQALAMLLGSAAAIVQSRLRALGPGLTLAFAALVTAWAFSRPDPLEPVPYVEGVFALAFDQSPFAGAVVAAGAIALPVGLYMYAFRGPFWLFAVATYYAALFLCSLTGLTPAPVVGYGAGPLLGFGFMVVTSRWVGGSSLPDQGDLPSIPNP